MVGSCTIYLTLGNFNYDKICNNKDIYNIYIKKKLNSDILL